jgi:hypothetical protein
MFQLDDNLLEELGLGAMPAEQKTPFLQHIYEQLEYKVGLRLSEGMTEEQLIEFESIFDRKEEVISTWLATHAPNYTTDQLFLNMQQSSGLAADHPSLLGEYSATKWLEVNRPDYRDVVASTLDELKKEIIGQREAILGGAPA